MESKGQREKGEGDRQIETGEKQTDKRNRERGEAEVETIKREKERHSLLENVFISTQI